MNKEIKDKIRILKLARTRIKNQNEGYICNAIESVIEEKPELFIAGRQIRSYIQKALNADSDINQIYLCINTLDGWINRYQPSTDFDQVEARLQWIDWMINCYEEDNKL